MKNRIKQLRMEYKVNQEKLAQFIGISQQTLSRIENDKTSVDTNVLVSLCKYFEVSADYILCLSDSRYTEEQKLDIETKMVKYYELIKRVDKLNDKQVNQLILLIDIFQKVE